MFRYLVPFFVLAGLVVLFIFGLQNDPSIVPSPLIDKPVPAFRLGQLRDREEILDSSVMKGEVAVLNVWASWCLPCRHEHRFIVSLAEDHGVKVYGLNYKDDREDAINWLQEMGDSYYRIFYDGQGTAGIELGVYGVPETFVLDRNGIIRYKHTGPISRESMDEVILPLIKRLQGGLS